MEAQLSNNNDLVADTLGNLLVVSPDYLGPVLIAPISDKAYYQGTGAQTVDAKAAFSGSDLRFNISTTIQGVTIDETTGIITIPTGATITASNITVTAYNDDGSAIDTFSVVISLEDTGGDPAATFPAMIDDSDWNVQPGGFNSLDETLSHVTIDPGAVPMAAQDFADNFALDFLRSLDATGEPANSYVATEYTDSQGWDWTSSRGPTVGKQSYIHLRYRRLADGVTQVAANSKSITGQTTPTDPGGGDPDGAFVTELVDGPVTWHFASPTFAGVYFHGQAWAQPPFSVTQIDPPCTVSGGVEKHGAMRDWGVNPPQTSQGNTGRYLNQGMDSRPPTASSYMNYDPAVNVDPGKTGQPISFSAGQGGTIQKGISPATVTHTHSVITDIRMLTSVPIPPVANHFRPGMTNPSKAHIWLAPTYDLSIFANVPVPSGLTGTQLNDVYDIGQLRKWFQNVHQHAHSDGAKQNVFPTNQMRGNSGAEYAEASTAMYLAMVTNYLSDAEKREILGYVEQQGIDIFDAMRPYPNALKYGRVYTDDGQLNLGRWAILQLAALGLNDATMKEYCSGRNTAIWRAGVKTNYGNPKPPQITMHHYNSSGQVTWSFNQVNDGSYVLGPPFQEQRCTFYVNQWHIDNPPNGPDGSEIPYPQSMLGKPEWGINALFYPMDNTYDFSGGSRYRQHTRRFYVGLAMAMHLTEGAVALANWPPFVDLVDFNFNAYFMNDDWNNVRTPEYHKKMYQTYRGISPNPIWPPRASSPPAAP